jgi:hypothetical protein
METAEAAASAANAALAAGDISLLQSHADAVDALRPKYDGYSLAERYLGNAWVHDILAWKASRSPAVRGAMTRMLCEQVDPGEAFSARGAMRLLLSR